MTKRKDSGARVRAPLTDLESEIMRVVWESGPSSVESVHQVLVPNRKLKETSVRTMLRRLEHKRYLSHSVEGRSYIYRAVEPASSLAARAVRQIIDHFCRGSVEELVAGMVDARVLNQSELKRLETMIRRHRKEGS